MKKKDFLIRGTIIFGIIVLIILISLLISSCAKTKKSPQNGLEGTYLTYTKTNGDKIEITKKELYEALLVQRSDFTFYAPSIVKEEMKKVAYKKYIDLIDEKLNTNETVPHDETLTYKEALNQLVRTAVFEVKTYEEYEELAYETQVSKLQQFVDSIYSYGIKVEPTYEAVMNNKDVLDRYKLELAKTLYAFDEYQKDLEESDNEIEDDDIAEYFEENYQNTGDVKVIIIKFSSESEAKNALRLIAANNFVREGGLTYDGVYQYNNFWYPVPALKCEGECTAEQKKQHYEEETTNFNPKVSSSATDDSYSNPKLTTSEVLFEFINIYNGVYGYKALDSNLVNDLKLIKEQKGIDEIEKVNEMTDLLLEKYNDRFTYSYQDLEKYGSTVRSYIYGTLTATIDKEEIASSIIQYTPSPKSTGTNEYYLAFKLQDHTKKELTDKYVDEDGVAQEITYKEKVISELEKEDFTESYITNKETELLSEVSLTIYDPTVELLYSLSNSDFKKSNDTSKTDVLKISYDGFTSTISVLDFYNILESRYGTICGFDLLTNKLFKESKYMDEITDEDIKEYKETFKIIIQNFSADYFSYYGLPASMGRESFLKIYFKANSNQEAIENFYIPSKIAELLYEDYETQGELMYNQLLDNEKANTKKDDYIYNSLAEIAKKYYDLTYTINVSALTIYYDLDEDTLVDNPTNLEDGLKDLGLTESDLAALNNEAQELLQLIQEKVSKSNSSHSDYLSSLIKEYNNAPRIDPRVSSGNSNICKEDLSSETQAACTWWKYKKDGLLIKTESIGDVTNQTLNTPGTYTNEFIANVYKLVNNYNLNKDVIGDQLLDDINNSILDENGLRLLYVTSQTLNSSFKYQEQDDKNNSYSNIIYDGKNISIYNDLEYASAEQIKLFFYEVNYSDGIENMPQALITAMETYFDPIYDIYVGTNNKMLLLYNYIDSLGSFDDTTYNNYLELLQINIRNLDSYSYFGAENKNNPYSNWVSLFSPKLARELSK